MNSEFTNYSQALNRKKCSDHCISRYWDSFGLRTINTDYHQLSNNKKFRPLSENEFGESEWISVYMRSLLKSNF